MAVGLRRTWKRGERSTVEAKNNKGQTVTLTGKHGGPVIKQHVELVYVPKEKP